MAKPTKAHANDLANKTQSLTNLKGFVPYQVEIFSVGDVSPANFVQACTTLEVVIKAGLRPVLVAEGLRDGHNHQISMISRVQLFRDLEDLVGGTAINSGVAMAWHRKGFLERKFLEQGIEVELSGQTTLLASLRQIRQWQKTEQKPQETVEMVIIRQKNNSPLLEAGQSFEEGGV